MKGYAKYFGKPFRLKKVFLALGLTLVLSACHTDKTINQQKVLFEIKKGDNMTVIAKRLKQEHIIGNMTRFRVLAKIMHMDRDVKVGMYDVNPNEEYKDLISKFAHGRTHYVRLTIPEGWTIFQIADLVRQKGLDTASNFIKACSKKTFLDRYHISYSRSLEGYLYPDTYFVPLDYKSDAIIEMMLNHFDEVVNKKVRAKIKSEGKTLNEILTMASIVEKEDRVEYEKPIIAGVYYNRLKLRMKLQADPTLIYALILDGEYHGDIKFKHLRPPWPSPYNTYYVYGLPPGPIANPGKTSILAVMFPANVPYLYFVANPANGKHDFSRTLSEHNMKVRLYQKRRK